MNFVPKNKKLIVFVVVWMTIFLFGMGFSIMLKGTLWTRYDNNLLDFFYKLAVHRGCGPPLSSQIVYITITNDTYEALGKNILDRSDMARLNNILDRFNTKVIAYDIIFAHPGPPKADQKLATSISQLGNVYLPIGLTTSPYQRPFQWKTGKAYERFRLDYLKKPIEQGLGHPLYTTHALMQSDIFSKAAFGSGHINVFKDTDGVYRRVPMLLKVDKQYFPALALSIFLDIAGISMQDITVHWGKEIIIPSRPDNRLKRDVIIPIDNHGLAFIPYAQSWYHGFQKISLHTLFHYADDPYLEGNLTDFFEDRFVLVGDVSSGISDLGQTVLDEEVPLIITHASMLNGMLTRCFYDRWSVSGIFTLITAMTVLLGLSALSDKSWLVPIAALAMVCGVTIITWNGIINFKMFPLFATGSSILVFTAGLMTGTGILINRERRFIKSAFSHYIPESVVNTLVTYPERLNLGGEERIITVVFSDLANFTRLSEDMRPRELVHLLNTYLTEMTDIVLEQGGIIDKYQGDAIMAEFGAPLPLSDHADRAVRTGLMMQRHLAKLRRMWKNLGCPELHCRVGINTGPMIIGNIGSRRVFDYTVIGDAVNLAARLESANKRYNTSLMISEFTHAALSPGYFQTRILDIIKVKGKSRSVKVFEVYGMQDETLEPEQRQYYQAYHAGFQAYLLRNFKFARKCFQASLEVLPNDPAARNMIKRMETLDVRKLPSDWDGSLTLSSK
jgi:adenylate cyclase